MTKCLTALRASLMIVILGLTAHSGEAFARQCQEWREGSSVPGVGGAGASTIRAMQPFDPDGPGPRGTLMVASGEFTVAGTLGANRIAAWDGTSWQPFGAGLGGPAYALTIYNGQLIAAGSFATASNQPANNIARWTGTAWEPLGAGINGQVLAMTVHGNQLIVGGIFAQAGGQPASCIAAWDGSAWSPLGSGMALAGGPAVRALASFNGVLYAGGFFSTAGGVASPSLAAWNGTAWSNPAPGNPNDAVFALGIYNNQLIMGGTFTGATGTGVTLRKIASWNGTSPTWQPLGTGVTGQFGDASASVSALTIHQNQLVAAGFFFQAGTQGLVGNVAVWNGTTWSKLGTGANGPVNAVASFDADGAGSVQPVVIVGGDFTSAGGRTARRIAQYVGSTWQSLGTGIDDRALAMLVYNGQLVAGGAFATLGGSQVNFIARWDGTTWTPFAQGLGGFVLALAEFQGDLIAAGEFRTTSTGAVTLNGVARWNGTAWQPMATGLNVNGNAKVRSLAVFNNQLYAGGDFTQTATGLPAPGIAVWTGTAWAPVGTGVSGGPTPTVFAMVPFQNKLYVGGAFTSAGGVPSPRIAAWDGTAWTTPTPGTFNSDVLALRVWNNQLVAAGFFNPGFIAAWDGVAATWSQLAGGTSGGIFALGEFDGNLVAGGAFQSASGISFVNNIATWNGVSWDSLGTGVDAKVTALATFDTDGAGPAPLALIAGGEFGTTGGVVSPFIGVWGPAADAVWVKPGDGFASTIGNWNCDGLPNAARSMLFDRVTALAKAGVTLLPAYRVSATTPITAEGIMVGSDEVTLNLAGRPISLVGVGSSAAPPVIIGSRTGIATQNAPRLLIRNTGGNPLARLTGNGVAIGQAVDPNLQSTLSISDPILEVDMGGNIGVGVQSVGTLEVRDGAKLFCGSTVTDYFAAGQFPAAGTNPNSIITIFNQGQVKSNPAGLRVVSLGSAVGSRVQMNLTGAGSEWRTVQNDLYIGDQGSVTLSISGGAQMWTSTKSGAVIGRLPGAAASVTIGTGSAWTEQTGTIRIGVAAPSTLSIGSGASLGAASVDVLQRGTLTGSGTIFSGVFNLGVVRPGLPIGTLTITEDFRQIGLGNDGAEAGSLLMDVAGTTPGTTHDRIVVGSQVELGGLLRVDFSGGFVPPADFDIELIRGNTVAFGGESFDIAILPALNDSRFLRIDYITTLTPTTSFSVRLAAAPLGGGIDVGTPQTGSVSGKPSDAVVADFNGDGAEDLAITVPAVSATTSPGSVVILFSAGNDSNGNWLGFGSQQTIPVGIEPLSIDAGDFNSDGTPDLAVANATSSTVSVILSSGTIGAPPILNTQVPGVGVRPVALAVANLNIDPTSAESAPEIVVASEGQGGEVNFIASTVGGTVFTPVPGSTVNLPFGSIPGAICTFDPDQDKNLRRRRIAVPLRNAGSVQIIDNNTSQSRGGFAFSAGALLAVGASPSQVIATDLRPTDGRPIGSRDLNANRDLVVINGDATASVLINSTTGPVAPATFRPAASLTLSGVARSITPVDVDLDGDSDLAVLVPSTGTSTTIQIVRNDFLTRSPAGVVTQTAAQPVLVPGAASLNGGPLAKILVAGRLSGVANAAEDLATIADPPGALRGAAQNVIGIPNRLRNVSAGCNPADICGVGATYDNGAVDVPSDGQLTIEDFLNFLSAFGDATGCPGGPVCNPADICGVGATYDNGAVDVLPDGTLTIEDFLVFLSAFGDSTGC